MGEQERERSAVETDHEPAHWWVERPGLALTLAIVIALAVSIAWGVLVLSSRAADGTYLLGTFGDSFGPVTAILNAIALGAAVVAVFIQRHELSLQRKEMEAQRGELAAQRRAAETPT